MYIHEKKTTLHLEVVCNFSGQLRFEIVWAARNSAMIHYCTGMFSLGTIHKRRLLRGGGRGVAKLEFWGDFQGVFGETRGGRVVKNHEKWGDVFYGWSLNWEEKIFSRLL